MKKKTYDLHDIYNQSKKLEDTLNEAIKEAVEKKIKTIEIIPGKGSGQLKKRVLRFLNQSHIKTQYHRIDKDSKNFGRLFVHFRH
ncbi:MAG: DNA mismatch repair protein MutS [Actinobacteria bacterium]|nr:DNA mismatch repair protein MutS [Actinomycetota bacterium]|tara:strand:- start:8254 stop:8508 length:255 start_codon:yes stop_codon:yes gene_type:complete